MTRSEAPAISNYTLNKSDKQQQNASIGAALKRLAPLMADPAARFGAAIDAAAIGDPVCPVIGNVEARPLATAAALRDELHRQIPSPVRWRETMLALAEAGVTSAYECGPGGVLAGLARRTTPSIAVRPLGTWNDVLAVADALGPSTG